MNFRVNDGSGFPGVRSLWAGALLLPLVACSLIGVEPDEIDLAMASESGGADETGELGTAEGDPDTGQNETTGDGGDGDGDAGDGDGDSGAGDGDGDPEDETNCAAFEVTPLVPGPVDATIAPGPSLLEAPNCGNPGPERIYTFSSDSIAVVELSLTADYEAVFYRVDGPSCQPLEGSCFPASDTTMFALEAGEVLYVALDAATPDGGSGTLDVVIGP